MGKLKAWALEYGMFDDDGPTQEQHDYEVMNELQRNQKASEKQCQFLPSSLANPAPAKAQQCATLTLLEPF